MSEVPSKDGNPTANAEAAQEFESENSTSKSSAEAPEVNDRLLKESKKWKEKAQTLSKELEALRTEKQERERKEQEEQGKFRELYERTRKELEAERNAVREERRNSTLKAKAMQLGCVDTEAALRLGDMNLLQYDEESRQYVGVDTFFEELKQKKPYLFQAKATPTINPKVPTGVPRESGSGLAGKSAGELSKLLAMKLSKR